jgi:hypothetical protein
MSVSNANARAGLTDDLPDLPSAVLTKDRQELNTYGDNWQLRANGVRDLKQTIEGLDVILGAGPTTGSKVVAPFEGEPSRFQELE